MRHKSVASSATFLTRLQAKQCAVKKTASNVVNSVPITHHVSSSKSRSTAITPSRRPHEEGSVT